MGNPGLWQSFGFHLTQATHTNTLADQAKLLCSWHTLNSLLSQQDSAAYHSTKTAQELLKECDKDLKVSTWTQVSPDPKLTEHMG